MALDSLDPAYPLYERLMNGTANRQLQIDAAKGLLPFDNEAMGDVLAAILKRRKDKEVLLETLKTIKNMPPELLDAYASGRQTPTDLLDAIGKVHIRNEGHLRKLVLNRATTDDTIAAIAAKAPVAIQQLIANNEERLLRDPEIVDQLLANPDISPDVRMQVLIRQEERMSQEQQRGGELEDGELEGLLDVEDSMEDLDEEDFFDDYDEEDDLDDDDDLEDEPQGRFGNAPDGEEATAQAAQPGASVPQSGSLFEKVNAIYASDEDDFMLEDEDEEADDEDLSEMDKIAQMSQADREVLAMTGNGTIRGYLIKDPSKNVAVAVVNSPKVQEDEVVRFSKLRNVHKDVLREIGKHREWAKYYQINLNLAKNPGTPYEIALSKLRMLHLHDLKAISKSREVSGAISNVAKKLVAAKERRRG